MLTHSARPGPAAVSGVAAVGERIAVRVPAPRSRALDLLRAAAILLVLGCHYVVAPSDAGYAEPLAALWYRTGWAGVDLFFVLSGYLVSGLLFAEFQQRRDLDLRRFLVRRGFKIWPPYLAYVAFVGAWLLFLQWSGRDASVVDLWPNLLHVQNYFSTVREHTWSLSLEEHFYLGIAFAALLVVRFRLWRALAGRVTWFVVAAIAAVAVARHVQFVAVGREALNLYATHLRFDGLLMGVLIGYWTYFEPRRLAWLNQRPRTAIALGLALALPTMLVTPDPSPWAAGLGLTAMYAGFGLILIGFVALERATEGRAFRFPGAGMLTAVGVFSYGIYLWHIDLARTPLQKVAAWLQSTSVPPTLVWCGVVAIYVLLAFGFGSLLSRLIEIPSLALRDRLFPARHVAATASLGKRGRSTRRRSAPSPSLSTRSASAAL